MKPISSSEKASPPARLRQGFTLIEILIAISLTGITFTAGTLFFQAISYHAKRPAMLVDVTLSTLEADNFYGLAQNSVSVYTAPCYGRTVFAEELRERFLEDVSESVAVFCLARNARNTIRPGLIPYPNSGTIRLDTPEAFRQHLVSEFPAAGTIFQSYRVTPNSTNGSIFVLGPSAVGNELRVIAIYEIDFVTSVSPAGTYASVRRHEGPALTNYYDVFYPQGTGTVFRPLFVAFEREERLDTVEGDAIDRFKKAKNYPFYFIWWPDPAAPFLEGGAGPVFANNDPRQAYGHMGGRTSYMFTVPLFPAF